MSNAILQRKIALAVEGSRVIVPLGAKKQMRKRRLIDSLTDKQILHVLLKGQVIESAHLDIYGNWQCTLEAQVAGDRIKVAAALVTDSGNESVVVVNIVN